MKHIHEMQFVESGGVKCACLGCSFQYSEKEMVGIMNFLANGDASQQSMHLTCFPACKLCEYNPCDLANNSDYCPTRR